MSYMKQEGCLLVAHKTQDDLCFDFWISVMIIDHLSLQQPDNREIAALWSHLQNVIR